ncbi:hypothetical protein WN51_07816 [Melipona quadrifasciata]|uniref:Uncharacterized protein n=1 Tax=Melipona quadrifasciata TaxID=166423 RepID=A0A0M9A949_9HYME|nr:hypothetical protein WN51_07816 [Melipona quadrifasciata]
MLQRSNNEIVQLLMKTPTTHATVISQTSHRGRVNYKICYKKIRNYCHRFAMGAHLVRQRQAKPMSAIPRGETNLMRSVKQTLIKPIRLYTCFTRRMITERFTREKKKKKRKRKRRSVITNSSEPVCTWHEAGGICQVTKVSGFRKYKKARGERRSNGWDLAQQLQSSFATTIGTYVSFSYVRPLVLHGERSSQSTAQRENQTNRTMRGTTMMYEKNRRGPRAASRSYDIREADIENFAHVLTKSFYILRLYVK